MKEKKKKHYNHGFYMIPLVFAKHPPYEKNKHLLTHLHLKESYMHMCIIYVHIYLVCHVNDESDDGALAFAVCCLLLPVPILATLCYFY